MAQLSNRYAAAIFELSVERGKLDENLDQAIVMRDKLEDKECQEFLTHPRIKATDKRKFFDDVFLDKINTDLMGNKTVTK